MKILFVDDDYEIAMTVRALKARYPDCEIILANSIRKTVEILSTDKFDRIVLDIMFPGGDELVPGSEKFGGLFTGIKLGEMIAAGFFPLNRASIVYYLTALDSSNHEAVADLQKRIDEKLIFKPVHTTELATLIGIRS